MEIWLNETYGIGSAMYGMRSPMKSHKKADTKYGIIGQRDLELALKLVKAGDEHAKFLRQIRTWMVVSAPRYWWVEMDTYKFHTTQSESTMHTLLKEGIDLQRLDEFFVENKEDGDLIYLIANRLNSLSNHYHQGGDKITLTRRAKKLLPESFIQERTIDPSYAELLRVYFQRRNHKLGEWREFCDYLYENLPYFKDFADAMEKRSK